MGWVLARIRLLSLAALAAIAWVFYDIAIKPVLGEIAVEYAKGMGLFDFTTASIKIMLEQILSSAWTLGLGALLLTAASFTAGACVSNWAGGRSEAVAQTPRLVDAPASALPPKPKNVDVLPDYPAEKLADLQDIVASQRDDHEIIPHRVIIRGTMNDDGYDIWAIIQYRNRGTRHLSLRSLNAHYELDGSLPAAGMTNGINGDLAPSTTDSITFKPVRVYTDRPMSGRVLFAFRYGARNASLRTILHMEYHFELRSFPPNKSTDAVLDFSVKKDERYFIGNPIAAGVFG